jgi:hypothetical protein
MNQRPLGVVTVYGGPRDGERFATPLDRLHQNTMIVYFDRYYALTRNPKSGRWQAFPVIK